MKFFATLLTVVVMLANTASGQSHQHHVRHNMILLGETEVFATHIVYKQPHNFQVILGLNLDAETKELYLAARKSYQKGLFIFLLDPTNIGEISSMESISGKILFRNDNDEEHIIHSHVTFSRENFRVIFFDELPLSLQQRP